MSNILGSLDHTRFFQIVPERVKAIESADASKPCADYPVNKLAAAMHPKVQYMIIDSIVDHGYDTRSYRLVPDTARGTSQCAYFAAGQYLSVHLTIAGAPITRPYSISSSPEDAAKGYYELTIKKAPDGFVSDYILSHWQIGDSIEISAPAGTFYYEPLRDAQTVVGIAGGSGVTPFISMAKAIADGTEDFDLILIYGSRTKDSILFKDELDALEKASEKIKVIHVLSHESADDFEKGFINETLIRKYIPDGQYSVFVSGPKQMYGFVDPEIDKLGLERKWIRHELFGIDRNPEDWDGYPEECSNKEFEVTIDIQGESHKIICKAGDSLLVSLEKAGIKAQSLCRSGECGYCHSRLVSGNVFVPAKVDYRRIADYDFGYIHPCCSFPVSDLELEIYP